jgi:hypothetical protein
MEEINRFLSQPDDLIIGSPATVTERLVDQAGSTATTCCSGPTSKPPPPHTSIAPKSCSAPQVVPAPRHAQVNDSTRAA